MGFNRARIINQSFVSGPAEAAWDILTDWHNTHRLRTESSASSPLAVDRVELIGEEDKVPRTRVFYFKAEGMPVVKETLLHQDDETMHLYYNIEGIGPVGIRNYLATTDVDRISDDLCQMTITARFDLPKDGDIVMAKNIINVAHNGVIAGLQYALTQN